jgi:hypothetical protein
MSLANDPAGESGSQNAQNAANAHRGVKDVE